MAQIEQPVMMPTRRVYEVEHDDQMSVKDTKTRLGSQKVARLLVVFNPYGGGSVITPSSGVVRAERDPRTKAILPTPVEIQCYASEVAEIEAWVEDRMDMVREMFASHDRMERAHIAKSFPGEYVDPNRSEWPPHFAQALMKLSTKDNPAAKFRSIVQTRDILPLLSCEVAGDLIDAPMTSEAKARATMVEAIQRNSGVPGGFTPEAMATALVAAFQAVGLGGDAKAGGKAVAEKLAAKDAEIERLKAELAVKK